MLLAFALLSSGCIQVLIGISVNEDGSGAISQTIRFRSTVEFEDGPQPLVEPETLSALVASAPPGYTARQVSSGEYVGVEYTTRFANPAEFSARMSSLVQDAGQIDPGAAGQALFGVASPLLEQTEGGWRLSASFDGSPLAEARTQLEGITAQQIHDFGEAIGEAVAGAVTGGLDALAGGGEEEDSGPTSTRPSAEDELLAEQLRDLARDIALDVSVAMPGELVEGGNNAHANNGGVLTWRVLNGGGQLAIAVESAGSGAPPPVAAAGDGRGGERAGGAGATEDADAADDGDGDAAVAAAAAAGAAGVAAGDGGGLAGALLGSGQDPPDPGKAAAAAAAAGAVVAATALVTALVAALGGSAPAAATAAAGGATGLAPLPGDGPPGDGPPDGPEGDEDGAEAIRYRPPAGADADAAAPGDAGTATATADAGAAAPASADRSMPPGSVRDGDAWLSAADAEARAIYPVDQFDPVTGNPLYADADGRVLYGSEFVSPEDLPAKIALDAEWQAGVERGQGLVDHFTDLMQQAEAEKQSYISELERQLADDPTGPDADRIAQEIVDAQERLAGRPNAELEAEWRRTVNEMNADYQAKILLKGEGASARAGAFDTAVYEVYGDVDAQHLSDINEAGFQRGGTDFGEGDVVDVRNKASVGTVGADRDLALQEMRRRELLAELRDLEPGSEAAAAKQAEYMELVRADRITVNYDEHTSYLEGKLAEAPAGSPRAEALAGELERVRAEAGGIKARHLERLNRQLEGATGAQAKQIRAEIAAAEGRIAGAEQVRVSSSRFNESAKAIYGRVFEDVTGTNADKASQAITYEMDPEAFRDLPVLNPAGADYKLDRGWSEQTGSVPAYKRIHNEHMAAEGHITPGDALQENARGLAKDMRTKVNPLLDRLEGTPGIDAAHVDRMRRLQETLDRIGRGEIPPSQADAALRAAIPEVPDITLDQALRIGEANLESAIKATADAERLADAPERVGDLGGPSRVQEAFGTVSDVATVADNFERNLAEGMGQREAMAVALGQVRAGNAMANAGIVDPNMSMVAGALLPGDMRGIMPDQMVEAGVKTAYQGGSAYVRALSDSYQAGQIDTSALDEFADTVANRQGADPLSGLARTAQLWGEESARTDGGSIAEDLQQIYDSGVAGDMNTEFQQAIAAGEEGSVLQGLDHVARIGSNLAVDPQTTVGEFVGDVNHIVGSLQGDTHWETASNVGAEAATVTVETFNHHCRGPPERPRRRHRPPGLRRDGDRPRRGRRRRLLDRHARGRLRARR